MLSGRLLVSGLLLLVACGDDAPTVDAGPQDGPPVTVDIDNGSCGDQIRFTGELVDWDSSSAGFCGINEALLQVEGDGAMDDTAPNGRFDLCIPDQPTTRLDVTQPAGASQCTQPPAPYAVPVIAIAQREFILAGGFWSGRAWTTARQAMVFQDAGTTFDPTRAQVLVHVDGPARAVSLSAGHGTALASSDGAWAPGATGTDVFFPNVEIGGGMTMVSVEGGAIGTGTIPLVAGALTIIAVKAN